MLYYLARKCWLKKDEIIAGSSLKDEQKWKMIAFQRLNFNEVDIILGLTDENLIGNGGSGKVYRVFINQGSTTVAVKSISNARKSDHRLTKEFLAEVQTLGTIRHNNIVKLSCCISGKELKLLVYQYFENQSSINGFTVTRGKYRQLVMVQLQNWIGQRGCMLPLVQYRGFAIFTMIVLHLSFIET